MDSGVQELLAQTDAEEKTLEPSRASYKSRKCYPKKRCCDNDCMTNAAAKCWVTAPASCRYPPLHLRSSAKHLFATRTVASSRLAGATTSAAIAVAAAATANAAAILPLQKPAALHQPAASLPPRQRRTSTRTMATMSKLKNLTLGMIKPTRRMREANSSICTMTDYLRATAYGKASLWQQLN